MLDYFIWGHNMKSLIYGTPVESEEDQLARVMALRMFHYQVLVIVRTRTWYVGTVYVLKPLVVRSSPSCKWTQNKKTYSKQQKWESSTCDMVIFCF